jgi:hypothetical protein
VTTNPVHRKVREDAKENQQINQEEKQKSSPRESDLTDGSMVLLGHDPDPRKSAVKGVLLYKLR